MGLRRTSLFDMVLHEVSTSTVKIWLGALKPSIAKPHNWQLVIYKQQSKKEQIKKETGKVVQTIKRGNIWQRPFNKLNKRFYHIENISKLDSNTQYLVEFQVRVNKKWDTLEKAFFKTLPTKLPNKGTKPFTVGVGSCFYTEHDGARTGQAYQALYENDTYRPDIKFLTGDQVYLDIGLGLYPLDESDCQDRIADDYAQSWKLLRSMFRRGGTWMIPDDHEYWNNYPFFKGFNPYLITLEHHDTFQKHWEKAAKSGIKIIQQVEPVRTFSIGSQLSFCVADLRSERNKQRLISDTNFKRILDWANSLTMPGVLVIPQPIIAGKGDKVDNNLPDWDQYNQLLQAFEKGKHDIVILTGDVHYGRVAEVVIGNSSNKLVEVITSPMSNLSELDGIAASTPKLPKKKFPFTSVNGMQKNKIKYHGTVTTESKWWDLRYLKRRTTEHFMTIDFYREDGKTKMKVHAWNSREMTKSNGLPKKIAGFNIKPITLN